MSNTLNILQIQRFCLHDGPGIRSTIFLKGCPLRCPWCSNPESQSTQPEILYKKDGTTELVGKTMTISQIVSEALIDRDYFEMSSGGVTISGGEALMQGEGVHQLLMALKQEGVHTTIQTTGYTHLEVLEKCEPYLDLILFDLKHHDFETHERIIGGKLEIVLDSLKYLMDKARDKVVVRIPVIPGFNYDEYDISEILKLASSVGVKEVHLLPFHQFGKSKYEQLKRYYACEDTPSLHEGNLKRFLHLGNSFGVDTKIQGQ